MFPVGKLMVVVGRVIVTLVKGFPLRSVESVMNEEAPPGLMLVVVSDGIMLGRVPLPRLVLGMDNDGEGIPIEGVLPDGKDSVKELLPDGKDSMKELLPDGNESVKELLPDGNGSVKELLPDSNESAKELLPLGRVKDGKPPLLGEEAETAEAE
jgi:hypothetical protein